LKIVGLTGGIGSGKTTVAKMFENLGIPVYYADKEAKDLMKTSESLRKGIIALLGEKAYSNDDIDRSYVAQIVFQDKTKLKGLNALVHPLVESHFRNWLGKVDSGYVIQENALIFENNKQSAYDAVITVTAPLATRLKRVMQRDGVTEKQVVDRIRNQLDDDIKIRHADFVVNNLDIEKCKDQVLEIHKKLLSKNP
jgi:dephospho-CoA kinase